MTIALVALMLSGGIASAVAADVPPVDDRAKTAESYSALECLQRATEVIQRPIDMFALLSSSLWQPRRDDTADQIANVAIEQKLNALVLDHLRIDQIRQCSCPLILHLKGGRYSTRPDCFVLCERVRGDQAQVFSPLQGDLSIPLSQLVDDRRGEAIAVSDEPIPRDVFENHRLGTAKYGMMALVVLSLAGFAGARNLREGRALPVPRSSPHLSNAAMELTLMTGFAVVLGFACRVSGGESMLPPAPADPEQVIDFLLPRNLLDAAKTSTKLPEISAEEALRLLGTDAIFVDARDLGEYTAGHIRGAIVCPASDIGRWHLHMAGVQPHRKIVVYCAEASCGKGEYVANFLLQNGFTDVCLYRDGWAKWTGPKEGT